MRKNYMKMKRRLLYRNLLLLVMLSIVTNVLGYTYPRTVTLTGARTSWITTGGVTVVSNGPANSSKTMTCLSSSSASYISNNSATGYVDLKLSDTSEKITKINIVWMSAAASQVAPVVFGESITLGTVNSVSNVISAVNGGFTTTAAISTSGNSNCPGEDVSFPISAKVQEIWLPRLMWNSATQNTASTVYGTYNTRLNNSSSTGYTNGVGNSSGQYIGQIIVTIDQAGTAPTVTTGTVGTPNTSGVSVTGNSITAIGSANVTAEGIAWSSTTGGESSGTFVNNGQTYSSSTIFDTNLSGLTANTKYYVNAYATNTAGTSWGTESNFTTFPNAPAVTTAGTATSSSIICNWTAPSPAGTATYDYYLEYGTDKTFAITTGNAIVASGTLTQTISNGLAAGTTYYYHVRARNLSGAQLGAWSSSYGTTATLISETAPTMGTTTGPTTIGATSASGAGGTITDVGSGVASSGVCWKTTAGATITDSKVSDGPTTATSWTNSDLGTSLTANTKYYLRSFAVTAAGTPGYGTEVNFITKPGVPTSAVNGATTLSSFQVSWTAPTGGSAYSVTYIMDYGTTLSYGSSTTASASTSVTVSGGLTGNTLYYYRIHAITTAGNSDYLTGTITTSPATGKAITVFTIPNQVSSYITESTHTINVVMPSGTTRMNLAPSIITVSTAAAVSPVSGVSQDFRTAKTYTVTAEDGTSQAYTVNVTNQALITTKTFNFDAATYSSGTSGYELNFIGGYFKSTSGGSTTVNITGGCGIYTNNVTTGSSVFVYRTDIPIPTGSSIAINASGTSSNRTLSKVETSPSLGGTLTTYTATPTGTLGNAVCGTISIPMGTDIASGTYLKFTLSGNINLSSIDITTSNGVLASQLIAPTALGSNTRTNQGFTATWSDVSNEIGYTVKVYKVSDNSLISTVTGIAANATSTVITGLDTGTSYTFTVTAIGDGDTYTNSAESSASSSITTFYSITASSNDTNKGTVSSSGGTFDAGTSMSFTATPTSGSYRFVNWTENGSFVSVANPYTFSASANRALIANFADFTTPISITTPTNASTFTDCTSCNVDVASGGTLVIDQTKTYNSVTVEVGGKLTLADGITLTAPVTLQSSSSGTGTFVDANTGSTPPAITGTVNQYLTSGRNWYISSPVTVPTRGAFNATSVVCYNEPTGAWLTETADSTFNVLKGYISASTTGSASFSGTLNTGSQSITVTRSSTNTSKPGFNLIGNPYPSYLNANNAINNATKMDKTIWYRTKVGSVYYFESVNTTTGEGTNNSGAGAVTGIIPPMQAFWVRVSPNYTSETLTFDNTMRSHASGSNPLKVRSLSNTTQQVLRLQVSNGTNNDETIIYTDLNAQNGFDEYDSRKMSNTNPLIPEIYTTAGIEQLVINGLNSITPDQEILLGFVPGSATTFSLKATQVSNFEPGTQILLKDYATGAMQDITDGLAYNFSPDNSVPAASRFALVFRSPSISTGVNTAADSGIRVSVNGNNQISVNYTGDLKGDSYVGVYNTIGQKLAVKQLNKSVTVIDNPLVSGVYFVTVSSKGSSVTQKVVVR